METGTAIPVLPEEETTAPAGEISTAETPAPDIPQEETPETAGPKDEAQKPDAPKKSLPLIPILAVLLVVLGVGELAFWSFAGLRVYVDGQERKLREEQQAAVSARLPAQTAVSGSSGTSQGGLGESDGPTRLSSLSVPRIPYALAEQEAAPGTDPSQPRRSELSVPRIPYDLAEQDPDAGPAGG